MSSVCKPTGVTSSLPHPQPCLPCLPSPARLHPKRTGAGEVSLSQQGCALRPSLMMSRSRHRRGTPRAACRFLCSRNPVGLLHPGPWESGAQISAAPSATGPREGAKGLLRGQMERKPLLTLSSVPTPSSARPPVRRWILSPGGGVVEGRRDGPNDQVSDPAPAPSWQVTSPRSLTL